MGAIENYMRADHRACDEEFSEVENAVDAGDFEKAQNAFARFADDMDKHFRMEEDVLFKAFNESGAEGCNPTDVMIAEHNQTRELLGRMEQSLANKDSKEFFGIADNMMILLQQHNMKEENIMYRLCDNALGGESEQVLERAKEIKDG